VLKTSLRATVARLAGGSRGRTEADLQADVRQFLLEAPLELAEDQVVEVRLEAPAGGGRRIDVEAGCAAIEVKKDLSSKAAFDAATVQLGRYVSQRTEELAQRYVGVLTDGQVWILFRLEPDGGLAEVSRLKLAGGQDAARLTAWLEVVLATTDKVTPSPGEIVRRLGADSPAVQLDLADLRALYALCRAEPEVRLKRQLWARLLLSALGTNFEDSDDLFVTHSYLVLVAELVAHEVMGLSIDAAGQNFRDVLEGHRFALAGLYGVVEADFFDWLAAIPSAQPVIAGIARRLSRFDWGSVEHDVLKVLYESVIDSETRRKLGEYYTPDWLAQKMVDDQLQDPMTERLLDPACGLGTFLFWAIRRVLAACDSHSVPNRDALDLVVRHVQGMDLHPVAVTLARVTYLLALTPERLRDRGEISVPVFLGDSVRWEHDDIALTSEGMTVRTSDELELVEDELHFPEGVLEEPARFDRLVADLADRAAKRKRNTKPPSIDGLLNRHRVIRTEDRQAVVIAFQKLCRLHDNRRDHVWSYYIRNRARPLAFMRASGRADVVVGNPPWLAYRAMPGTLQRTYRALAVERGLWAGGKVATHQDLSDLFVVRTIEQYLRDGGRFAFVMPYAVLSRRQFAGFRTGTWGASGKLCVLFARAEEFARVKPPLFPVPSAVVSGVKSSSARMLPSMTRIWTGRLPSHQLDWPLAAEYLVSVDGDVQTASDVDASHYRSRFQQGASMVPRTLLAVERRPTGPLGIPAGQIPIRSARSSNENPPWKSLASLEGVVEDAFVREMYVGATIVAFRARAPWFAVVPLADRDLLDGSSDRLDEFPGLAEWWREAETIWDTNRTGTADLTLHQQIDFQKKLTKQFPIARECVVYTKSGQHLAACRISDEDAVIDHTLYWAAMDSPDEGRYLCAVLNSQSLSDAVSVLQARGQHNPRHFDMHVFALPFPVFDQTNEIHNRLARLAERAEAVAASVHLDDEWQFQKSRRVMREALREDGIAGDLDEAVRDLLEEASSARGAPDLMDALRGLAGRRIVPNKGATVPSASPARSSTNRAPPGRRKS
jgi:hypothetical protein